MWWSEAARHHGLEGPRLAEVLEGDAPELLALRSIRIDRGDVVAGGREGARQLAAPAPDLQDPGGRRRQASEHERREIHR